MVTPSQRLIAGVELGGTKSDALIARGARILRRARIATGKPKATLSFLSSQIAQWQDALGPVAAIGIGSFGPLALDPAKPNYGRVTQTPKPGWTNADVLGHFRERFDAPLGFDTDVTGAALAEHRWGAAKGCDVVVYLTIGTGIGGGLVIEGKPVHGLVHPEMGHVRVRRVAGDAFPGACPFHGDCIEGLASGPAIAARAGAPAGDLPPDHPVWPNVADDLAELMASLILTLSPQRILIGGGVAQGKPFLIPMICERTAERLAGYVHGLNAKALSRLIRLPALGDRAGPLGAIALGLDRLAAG